MRDKRPNASSPGTGKPGRRVPPIRLSVAASSRSNYARRYYVRRGLAAVLAVGMATIGPWTSAIPTRARGVDAPNALALAEIPNRPADAALKAAAWQRWRGKIFIAGACLKEPPPRLGCNEVFDVSPRPVPVVPVTPENEALLSSTVHQIEGTWRGDSYLLRVDSQRSQANTKPTEPFEWKRFVIRRISESAVDFAVGTDIFEAKFADSHVVLSSTSFRGERTLTRE